VLIAASSKARWCEASAATAHHNYHDNNDCGTDGGGIVGHGKELDICKLGQLVSKQKVFLFESI
jgi:hypothetical protein